MTLCLWVSGNRCLEKSQRYILVSRSARSLDPQYECTSFLPNIRDHLPNDTASHPRRRPASTTPISMPFHNSGGRSVAKETRLQSQTSPSELYGGQSEVLQLSAGSIILPMLCTHSFTYRRKCITLATVSILEKTHTKENRAVKTSNLARHVQLTCTETCYSELILCLEQRNKLIRHSKVTEETRRCHYSRDVAALVQLNLKHYVAVHVIGPDNYVTLSHDVSLLSTD